MDFGLSSEDAMIGKAIREWVNKECPKDIVRDMDDNSQYPEKLISRLSRLGFNGLAAEEAYGGEGINVLGACLITMEIASRYPVLARCYAMNTILGGLLLSDLGDEAQKRAFLPGLSGGELNACAAPGTHRGNGEGLPVTAKWDAQAACYCLNGTITYMENADHADILILPVEIKEEGHQPPASVCYMILDAKADKIRCSPMKMRMGYKGLNCCTLECLGLKVSADRILGGPATDQTGHQEEAVQNLFLLSTAFEALGIAKGAYASALDHARQRVQFNRPIGKFPAICRMISEITRDLQAAELLSFKTAWKAGQGQNISQDSAVAAWTSLLTAQRAAQEGLQIFGGYGYTMEYDVQRFFRDVTVLMNSETAFEHLSQRIGLSTGLSAA